MKKLLRRVGKIVISENFQLGFNIFLGLYAAANMIGGAFYDIEVNATSVGIWVSLAIFNSVSGDKLRKLDNEFIDMLKGFNDDLLADNKRLVELLKKKK